MTTEERKFGELILYLAKLSEADPKCGRTKLNKLLFYADFRAYERFGVPISGQRYQKRDYGPTAGSFMPVVRSLEEEHACIWADRTYHGKPMKKLLALREPDIKVFRPEEIDLIHETLEEFLLYDAREMTNKTHVFAGYQAAEIDEEIPYNMVFVDDARPLSPEEEAWALSVFKEYHERKAVAG
jgi:Antitoxin SocA-like, Panacea domain